MNTNKSINTIKILSCEMINEANSGHTGIVLGAATIFYVLFTKHLRINPEFEKWINRDRFILSAGHGSALLYSLLHLSGFDIKIKDLKNFRKINSITPGHPEFNITPGVDATTGPLGQGIAMAVGQALAEKFLSNKFNINKLKIFDHYTYVLCGDGDLQEGITQEAISLAGHWKLNKLIILFDSNDVQLDSKVKIVQSENIKKRFKSCNWEYILVNDGNSINEIDNAIIKAKKNKKPTLIEIKTIIGLDSSKQNSFKIHGIPLGDEINILKKKYNLFFKNKKFFIDNIVYEDFKTNVKLRGENEYKNWINKIEKYKKNFFYKWKEIENILNKNYEKNFIKIFEKIDIPKIQSTRISSGEILKKISDNILFNLIGGSADLSSSTKIKGSDGLFSINNNFSGRNIAYGVREFAMAAINNGIYLHGTGLLPFCSTFLVFSDYMKPAIRLSSIMEIPVIYIFSHDSIAVGEDGPTHQPIEQIQMLRSQNNLNVFRPCDFKETLGSYDIALNEKKTPSVILVSRQDVKEIKNTNSKFVKFGAYKVYGNDYNNDINIFATGSEVQLAIEVAKKLKKLNFYSKVISMPCWEIFEKQKIEYKNKLIEKNSFKVSIELSSTFGWEKYTGNYNKINFGINKFGISGSYKNILDFFNFNSEYICKKIIKKIRKGE